MKRLGALVLAAAIAATVGIVGVSPASASTAHSVTVTLTGVGTPPACDNTTPFTTTSTVIYAKPGDTVSVTWTGFEVEPATLETPAENCGIVIRSVGAGDMTGWSYSDGFTTSSLNNSRDIAFNIEKDTRDFTVGTVETEFLVYWGGEGLLGRLIFRVILGDPPPTSSDSRPIVTTLTMSYGDEEACASNSIAGVRGQWVDLPVADTCTNASRSSAVLLGWATQPDFPVTIAQRQIDNGWGAYETFNPEGQLTGVFIPAGGATVLSNDNVLHAIWSN